MNDFCRECCGGDKEEVKNCDDKNCPFYRDRRTNLDWQNKRKNEPKLS
jgi:hypothetical protein